MNSCLIFVGKDLQGAVPGEIQVIPFGRTETPKGTFVLDDASAQAVMNAFGGRMNDMVIDYEHQTLSEPPVEAPAAGWIKKLTNKGSEGIWAVVEWTEKARQYITNREYRYVSPVFLKSKTDNKVVRLINVALTNQPNIDGMVPLMNKFEITNKEGKMEKELLEALGLAEGATIKEAVAAVNKIKTTAGGQQIVANKAVLTALGLADAATESEITGTIMAMKQGSGSVAELTRQVNSLTASLAEKNAAEAVEAAVNAGKITPAQKEWAADYAKRDLAGFQVFVSKAPVVVVQGKVIEDKKPEPGAIDENQAMINKLCGVDDEVYKKFGPKDETM